MLRRPRRLAPAVLALACALAAAPVPAGAQAAPAPDRYVDRAYADLLGRAPTPFEREGWVADLTAGTPRRALTRTLVQSEEFEVDLVGVTYLVVLGRTADEAGLAYWADRLAGGLTSRQLEAALLGSTEFEQVNGGAEGATAALFDVVLQRPASPGDVAYFAGLSRAARTNGVLKSVEAARVDVTTAYLSFLGRAPDADGTAYWVSVLRPTGDEQGLWAALTASAEYAARAEATAADRGPGPSAPAELPTAPVAPVLAARLTR